MKKYDFDFERDLEIDKYKLEEECLSHSTLFFRYAEASVEAKSEVSRCDDLLKLVYAEENIRIRADYNANGVKFTEALITSELEKSAKVKEAKEKLRVAQDVYGKLQVAVQAMDTRRSELDNLVKLYCAGYFSNTTVKKEQVKEDVATAIRKKLNKK